MNSQDFLKIINDAFTPSLTELGFSAGIPLISGRLYDVNFTGQNHVVSVSFEPGDEYLLIIVFGKDKNHLSNIDDRDKSPRLEDLNKAYMSMVTDDERKKNELFFHSVFAENKNQKLLLKAAKALRLVLPKYLAK